MEVSDCSGSDTGKSNLTLYSFDEIVRQEGVYISCNVAGIDSSFDGAVRFITLEAHGTFTTLWYNKKSKQLQPVLKRAYGGHYFKKINATVRFEIEE